LALASPEVRHQKKYCTGFLVLVLLLTMPGKDSLLAADFVYRPQFGLEGSAKGQFRWLSRLETYLVDNAHRLAEIAIIGGLQWAPSEHVVFAPEFKYAPRGQFTEARESQLRFKFSANIPISSWQVNVRNRFDYRQFVRFPDYWRYRLRFELVTPVAASVQWYTSSEYFYEFGNKAMDDGHRIAVGSDITLEKHLALQIEMRFNRRHRDDKWVLTNLQFLNNLYYSF
jgi:hypothetical protein